MIRLLAYIGGLVLGLFTVAFIAATLEVFWSRFSTWRNRRRFRKENP